MTFTPKKQMRLFDAERTQSRKGIPPINLPQCTHWLAALQFLLMYLWFHASIIREGSKDEQKVNVARRTIKQKIGLSLKNNLPKVNYFRKKKKGHKAPFKIFYIIS